MSPRFEEWYAKREWWKDNKQTLSTHWNILLFFQVNEADIEALFDDLFKIVSEEYGN